MPTGLDLARDKLGWPSREEIVDPPGAGPKMFARLAQKKIQSALRRLPRCESASVGVLTHNPESSATEAPLAIVCEFNAQAPPAALRALHRLAWNFSHSPLLITLEPTLVRAWTCCKHPEAPSGSPDHAEIPEAQFEWRGLSAHAARALGWVELLSGDTFRKLDHHFRPAGRVDQLLLGNLKHVRGLLLEGGLPVDVCHDLLARVIFTQFLRDRKDSAGRPALDRAMLGRLAEQGVLRGRQDDLSSILRSRGDAYRLFRWLNERFNGDLFPGKGETAKEREDEWQAEMEQVTSVHLRTLADFASGQLDLPTAQRFLWREYSFDTMPLEFVSSVYEEFAAKNEEKSGQPAQQDVVRQPAAPSEDAGGVHYTPEYLADLVLDRVLPWHSNEWDVSILDPACGSGMFLVKAYQRLIHRWRAAHPGQEIGAASLRELLETRLFGVDIDHDAVRVASFSLYLAMCDEIDPRWYWTQVRFPRLRGRRLIEADFFRDDLPGFQTIGDHAAYDLVVGNAPWGKKSETAEARRWAESAPYRWRIADHNIGPLFLAKSASLTGEQGRVALVQPASALLFNRESTAREFREQFFSRFRVEEVINLSALRFGLFTNAVSPTCVVVFRPSPPNGQPLSYVCPKATRTAQDDYRVTTEPQDINQVSTAEAARDPAIWSVLAWGGRRDLSLVRRLERGHSLAALGEAGHVCSREGVIRGDKKREQPKIVGRRMLETAAFPKGTFIRLDAASLPVNQDPHTDSRASTDLTAFQVPQLLVKQTWRRRGRFQAALVESECSEGALCSQSYVSIHAAGEAAQYLEAAWLAYNSRLAVYYLLLTSGRFAFYIPEPLVQDMLRVPIPDPHPRLLAGLQDWRDVDARTKSAFELKEAEWTLVEDLCDYTLPDFRGGRRSPGRGSTRAPVGEAEQLAAEPYLTPYCEFFLRVLAAGFGSGKDVSATIFQECGGASPPVRMVAIHLDYPNRRGVHVEAIESSALRARLDSMYSQLLRRQTATRGGIAYHRVARIYDVDDVSGRKAPTVFLVKPDQIRYWTRSMALRDADEVAGDIMLWREEAAEDAGEC